MRGFLGALALAALAGAALAAPSTTDFVNAKVQRRVDVSRHVVRATTTIELRGGASAGKSKYFLALPSDEAAQLAFLRVKDQADRELPVSRAPDSDQDGFALYLVQLPAAVQADSNVTLTVDSGLAHALRPFPEEISQADTQMVVFEGEASFPSPYVTEKAATTFKVGSSSVESFTDSPAVKPVKQDKEKRTLRYGTYSDVQPYDSKRVRLHFENNTPFVTLTLVDREIEVSQWGNVAVEEHYDLTNTGAKLGHGFSRIDYQMRQWKGNSFRGLHADLPAGASDVYYRDIIGNISTSNVREEKAKVDFAFETRFPIFGGWKTQWYHGYNLPSQRAVTYDAVSGRYTLTLPMNVPLTDPWVVDEYVLKVVLPEGAYDIDISTPYATERSTSRRFTYLDSPAEGRPVTTLKAARIVPDMSGNLVVAYSMPPMFMLREPLFLVSGFFALFLAYALLSRVDLSLKAKTA